MKLIIAGSRGIRDRNILHEAVSRLPFVPSIIVSGAAPGVDRMGEEYAGDYGIPCELHPADWDGLGRRAGYVRNAEMAAVSDALLAIWDGRSPGTKMMIDIMLKAGKPVYVWRTDIDHA